MIARIFCFLLILSSGTVISQVDFNNYKSLVSVGKMPEDFSVGTLQKSQNDFETADIEVSDKRKSEFIDNTRFAIDGLLQSGFVVYGDPVSEYIEAVAKKVMVNEPKIVKELRFYTLKSNETNAFSTDQGIIFVTTGLIAQLSSEAQLAYILAHEIAHYTEKHVAKTFEWKVENNNFGANIKQMSQYSQDKEFEADKVGLKWYNEAGYSLEELRLTFDVLLYSYLPFDEVELPRSYFNDDLVFVPESLFPKEKTPINVEEDYNDEFHSHPNIRKRKDGVNANVDNFENWGTAKFQLGEDKFNEVRNICRFEVVQSDIIFGNIAGALYSIFLLEKSFPESNYLKESKAMAWLTFYNYELKGRGGSVIPSSKNSEGESADLNFFLRKLKSDQVGTFAIRYVYDYAKNCNDAHKKSVFEEKLLTNIAKDKRFNVENYSKLTFSEMALRKQADTSTTQQPEVKSTGTKTKYDKIKASKNIDNVEAFDSTKFHFYMLSDIISNESFLAKIQLQKAKNEENERAQSNDRGKKGQTRKMENELIAFLPEASAYMQGNVRLQKNDALLELMQLEMQEIATDAHVKIIPFNSLSNNETDAFNLRNALYMYMFQLFLYQEVKEDSDFSIIPVGMDDLKSITDNHAKQIIWSGVETNRVMPTFTPKLFFQVFHPPSFFRHVTRTNETAISMLVFDIETGEILSAFHSAYLGKPSKWQVRNAYFHIFNTEF